MLLLEFSNLNCFTLASSWTYIESYVFLWEVMKCHLPPSHLCLLHSLFLSVWPAVAAIWYTTTLSAAALMFFISPPHYISPYSHSSITLFSIWCSLLYFPHLMFELKVLHIAPPYTPAYCPAYYCPCRLSLLARLCIFMGKSLHNYLYYSIIDLY